MQTISTQMKRCTEIIQSMPHLKESGIRKIFKNELPVFSRKNLKIRTDEGLIPFVFNREQWYIHVLLEKQKKLRGWVRAIILKGRQQGCSTYVAARFYHRTIHKKAIQTFILTHEGKATETLFEMVKRFHDNSNTSIRPIVGKSNVKELKFPDMDSAYKVGTADNETVGRSMHNQQLHASEVAFWRVGETIAAGAFKTVHKVPNSELILESTANGMGNFFHKQWKLAEQGKSPYGYMPIFIPWYWHGEYQLPLYDGFELTDSDIEYQKSYNLTIEQMVWRRTEQEEFGEILFKQEYPATPDEAFQVTGKNKLINTLLVTNARKRAPYKSFGAIAVGYDPKRDGMDRDCVIYRQGLNAFDLSYYNYERFPEKVALCKRILLGSDNNIIPDALFLDYGGGGWEIAGMLRQDMPALAHKVKVVNFGAASNQIELFSNKRNEIWQKMEKWLADENEPPSIPDDDDLHADLVIPGFSYDSKNRKVMQSKKEIKKELGCSPDGGDALALTFAEPVVISHVMEDDEQYQLKLSGE